MPKLIFAALLASVIFPLFVDAQTLTNWLTSPNGGEVVPQGNMTVYVNKTVYNPNSIGIEIYNGTTRVYGPWMTNPSATGNWIPCGTLPVGANYKIRVYDLNNSAKEDWSDAPFIIGPNLASWITSPNTGKYSSTSTFNVTFNTSTYNPSSVTLEVYKGSTRVWGPQTGGTSGRTITLPGVAFGTDYRVKAYDTNLPGLVDWSDNYLSVLDFSHWVINPNGGGVYVRGNQIGFSIDGSMFTPSSSTPTLELYKGSTMVQGPIQMGSTGYFTLSTSLTPGSDYKLRAYDTSDATRQDYSDAPFTIGPNLASWIQTPNAGTYALNSSINVSLVTGTYNPSSVTLELYKGSTKVWGPVAGATTGRTIPLSGLVPGNDYKVKAYDTSIPTLVDWSDNNISILDFSHWVINPNGGGVYNRGEQIGFAIDGSMFTPSSSTPTLELYKGSTIVQGPIQMGSIGYFTLSASLAPGSDYKLRAYDASDPTNKQDYSDAPFTIGPNLASWIQTPNGGAIALNTPLAVVVNTTLYNPASLTIELYKGATKVWGPENGPATGRTVPTTGLTPGNDYKLKVYDTAIPVFADWSDNNCKVLDLSHWILNPNGGGSATLPGSISFSVDAGVYSVPSGSPAIELYKGTTKVAGPLIYGYNGGISIPAGIAYGGDFKLKAYDPYYPAAYDFSDDFFYIGTDQNYVRTQDILVSGVRTEGDIVNTSNKIISTAYYDGLGRPVQKVLKGASPLHKDVITPAVYDAFGRPHRSYLPFTAAAGGTYTPTSDIVDNVTGDYKGIADYTYSTDPLVAATTQPFAKTIYEASPLNRATAKGAPGSTWQPNSGSTYESPIATDRSVLMSYGSNLASEVLKWTFTAPTATYVFGLVNASAGNVPTYYSFGELYRTSTKDEHHNETIEYKDKAGRVVLKKVQKDATEWAQTYYIYDDRNNVVCVIPPEAVKAIIKTPTSDYFNQTDAIKDAFLKRWAFRYAYNYRNRMIWKQVPGAEPLCMVYDDRDRLILTQDGNQRSGAGSLYYWSFTKYDQQNRPVLTGIKDTTVNLTQEQMQTVVNTHFAKTSARWSETMGGTVHQYTNRAYPVLADPMKYLTVTYYDNYSFKSLLYDNTSYNYSNTELGADQPVAENTLVKGQITGSKTKVLDGGISGGVTGGYTWLNVVNYYDDNYRVVQRIADNYKGGRDYTTTKYDFRGKPLKTRTTHIERDLTWKDKVAIALGGNIVRNNSGAGGWGSSGAASIQQLAAGVNGWIELIVSETNTNRMLGLSDANPDAHFSTIDYALYLNGTTLTIFENNASKWTQANGVVPGDVLRIERTGTSIAYKKNGATFYTSTVSSGTLLMGDMALQQTGATLAGIRSSFSTTSQSITRRFEYDHAERLVKTWHQVNSEPEVLLTQNDYNEIGLLIDKKLHSSDGTSFKQSVDYRYNIRGWLTSINNSQLTSDNGATNDDTNDLFGMQLAYDADLGTGNNNDLQFNGNISAVKWNADLATGAIKERAYNYKYDGLNRISESIYKENSTSWSSLVNNGFAETGYAYDLNGNITRLQRNDKRNGTQWMDDLTYSYASGTTASNKLLRVTDAGDKFMGFIDGTNTGDDYTYDANGNMITDQNKGITTAIGHNYMNLPETITKGANSIRYIYDASGRKLAQVVNFGNEQRQSEYIGEFRYENDALVSINHEEGCVSILNPKLIVTLGGDNLDDVVANNTTTSLVTQNGQTYIRVVSNGTTGGGVKDLGGVIPVQGGERYKIRVKGYRDKGTAATSNMVYLNAKIDGNLADGGSLLPLSSLTESWIEKTVTIPAGATALLVDLSWSISLPGEVVFINEFDITKQDTSTPEYQFTLKDHLGNSRVAFTTKTSQNIYTASLEDNTQSTEQKNFNNYSRTDFDLFDHTDASTTYHYSQLLNGGVNSQIGLAKTFSVMPGDLITAEVWAKYEGTTGDESNLDAFANALLAAFSLSIPAVGEVHTASAAINSYGSLIATGNFPGDNEWPKGWLNILVFDHDYNLVDLAIQQLDEQYLQTHDLVKRPHGLLAKTVTIDQPGYVYIYVSNEGSVQQNIYFDDLKITYAKSPVTQQNDYYPFGLAFNEYQREGSIPNMYKYNGKEEQDELSIGWLDYGWRMYDPSIARWHNTDALADMYLSLSPYTYVANNPIKLLDPDGRVIEGDKDEVEKLKKKAETLKKSEHKLQSRLASRAAKRVAAGKSTTKLQQKIAKSRERVSEINEAIGEIAVLEKSSTVYHINTNYASTDGTSGETTYDNGTVMVNVSKSYGLSGLAHELKHAHQFEVGKLDFKETGGSGLLHDITDEIAAFRRQYAFKPTGFKVDNASGITAQFVTNLHAVYRNIPQTNLNINSTAGAIEWAYKLAGHPINWINLNPNFYNIPYSSDDLPKGSLVWQR